MDEKTRCWILFAIKELSGKYGTSVDKLIEQSPKFMPSNPNSFFETISELEKEGLIELNKAMTLRYYNITKRGINVLKENLKKLGNTKCLSLVETIPQAKFKHHLRIIESFLGSLLLTIVFLLILYLFQKDNFTNPFIIIPTITLFFFFLISFLFSASSIVSNFLYSFVRTMSKTLWELIEPYKKIFTIIFGFLLIIGGLLAFVSFTKYSLSDLIYVLIPFILIGMIKWIKKTR